MITTASLSAPTQDVIGTITVNLLPLESNTGAYERRVSRVKTLDGSYALNDFGFAHCDRTAVLVWRSDEDLDYLARRLVEYYSTLHMSCSEGFFLVAPKRIGVDANRTKMEVLILEKIA